MEIAVKQPRTVAFSQLRDEPELRCWRRVVPGREYQQILASWWQQVVSSLSRKSGLLKGQCSIAL